jgi:hypothetical protein
MVIRLITPPVLLPPVMFIPRTGLPVTLLPVIEMSWTSCALPLPAETFIPVPPLFVSPEFPRLFLTVFPTIVLRTFITARNGNITVFESFNVVVGHLEYYCIFLAEANVSAFTPRSCDNDALVYKIGW